MTHPPPSASPEGGSALALEEPPPASLSGEWVWVPKEPTEAMARSGCYHRCASYQCIRAKACLAELPAAMGRVGGVYRAMIAASPSLDILQEGCGSSGVESAPTSKQAGHHDGASLDRSEP